MASYVGFAGVPLANSWPMHDKECVVLGIWLGFVYAVGRLQDIVGARSILAGFGKLGVRSAMHVHDQRYTDPHIRSIAVA